VTSARVQSIVRLREPLRYAAAAIPGGVHESLPVPVLQKGGTLKIAAMYCRAEIVESGAGLQLWPPSRVAWIDARSGRLELLRAVTPADFGRSDDPDRPLGAVPPPAERMGAEHQSALALFLQAFDAALPHFVDQTGRPSVEASLAARELGDLFGRVAEMPLRPYYRALSPKFFAWLEEAGR
jgi:hypothetical protein